MTHTECKDCKLREGDCGHHHRIDGDVNLDIPSLSSCDKYGNCGYFQQKETPKGDLISREALKKAIENYLAKRQDVIIWETDMFNMLDNAPTVETKTTADCITAYGDGYETARRLYERPQGEWVENLMHNTICSNCHGIRRDNRVDYIAFCNKCGAEMRGKEE